MVSEVADAFVRPLLAYMNVLAYTELMIKPVIVYSS